MKTTKLFVFMTIRVVLNTAYRMVYPFLRIFGAGLGVDYAAVSNLIGWRSFVGIFYSVLFPFIEPRGRRFGMLLGLCFFILAMGVVVISPTLPAFGLSLILGLASKAVFDPSLTAYMADHTPYEQRGRAVAILEFAWSAAFIAGIPAVGYVIHNSNWSTPFSILAILGIAALAYVFFVVKDSPKPEHHESGVFGNISAIISSPVTLVAMSIGLSVTAANELVNIMFGVWLEDSFNLKIAALGAASAVIGLSELSGEGLVFFLVDRVGKVRASGIGLLANCVSAILLPVIGHTQFGALTGLFLFYITFEFTIVSIIPLMTEVMPSARATTLSLAGAAHSVGRALGAFLGPLLYTLGFPFVTGSAVVFNMIGLLAVWYVSKHHD
jgi:predicted MFS family arabinose efflux permease